MNFFNDLTKLENSKTDCDVIYIDFSKAFDRIPRNKLVHVLQHYNINRPTVDWIQDLLSNRLQKTVVENEFSNLCSVTSGVPQGSVLGPLLFVLYLESLLGELQQECVHTNIYAFTDDVKLLSNDSADLQKALNIIEAWALKWELLIQPAKSEHLSFSFNTSVLHNQNTFTINNAAISLCESVTDLGIVLSNNLKWSNYIQKITTKANTISYTILRAFQSRNINLMVQLFKTYVRPILEYNTSIWTPHLSSDKKCVEKVQRNFTKRLCQKHNVKFRDYSHRLQILKLESLEIRRIKFDLILVYKIYHGIIDIDFNNFFQTNLAATKYNLRGHDQRLQVHRYSGSTTRNHFFSNRVLDLWNKLPPVIINSETLDQFKSKLHKFELETILTPK